MAVQQFKDEAEWRALRSVNVGASEVSALFGLSPWTTKWKLFMEKTGKLPSQDEKAWMSRGRHFEPAIAAYAAEEFELSITKVAHYWSDDQCAGLGSSLDYTLSDDHGVPIEIKWVERADKEKWEWEGADLIKIPDYYLLQVQHQMACTGANRGMLIAFVGNEVRRMVIPRSEALIRAIRQNVMQFWADVKMGIQPPVDFLNDADSIMLLAKNQPLRSIELPPHAVSLCEVFVSESARAKDAEDAATRAKSEIVKMVMDAGIGNEQKTVATCSGYRISLSKIDDSVGKLVTAEMIGTHVGARRGYLRTTITQTG